jgi:hypothetical protein
MPTFATPVTIDPRRGVPSNRLGPGQTTVVLKENNYVGLPTVPYKASTTQIELVDASRTLEYSPNTLICDATSASITLTLPMAASAIGTQIRAVKFDSSVNTVSFAIQGTDTLWANTGFTSLTKQYESIAFMSIFTSSGAYGWIALLDKVVV